MRFIILVKDTAIAEHLVSILEKLGMDHYIVTTSLKIAKDRVSNKVVNCIIFDRVFCKEGYKSLIHYFGEPHICYIPIKQKWNNEEAIEAINAGMSYILTYDCTIDKIEKCITSVEAQLCFPLKWKHTAGGGYPE